jgi:predicted alpha/beta hydrolase
MLQCFNTSSKLILNTKKIAIGHSFGGQIIGMISESQGLDAVIMVA